MSLFGTVWIASDDGRRWEALVEELGALGVKAIVDPVSPVLDTVSAVVVDARPDVRLERMLIAHLQRGAAVIAFGVELPPTIVCSPLTRLLRRNQPTDEDIEWIALLAHTVMPRPPLQVPVPEVDAPFEDTTEVAANVKGPTRSDSQPSSPTRSDPFMRIAAHELRSPMVSLIGTTESLMAGVFGHIPDHLWGPLQTLERGGRHMLDTVNRVLDLVKLEQGHAKPEIEFVSVRGILESVGYVLRHSLSRRAQTLETHLEPSGLCIESDAQWIAQILVNLVSNAIKFSKSSSHITLSCVEDESRGVVRFSVADSGIGIAVSDQKRIFEPFVRLPAVHQDDSAGCGIGLTLIARMSAALGGRVDLQSILGVGSTFTVTLPLRRTPHANPEPPPPPPRSLKSASGLFIPASDLAVLVIDDNQSNIDTLRPYLESKGWRVMAHTDPVVALRELEGSGARAVVLDIQMPILSGYEVARRIRSHSTPSVNGLPILALSALSGDRAQREAIAAGCSQHIEKPSRLSNIEASLRVLVIDWLARGARKDAGHAGVS